MPRNECALTSRLDRKSSMMEVLLARTGGACGSAGNAAQAFGDHERRCGRL